MREGGVAPQRSWCQGLGMLSAKHSRLRALLESYGSCLVAYSGGVDSVFLAKVAHEVLGVRALAAIADSPSLPRRELSEALQIGERFGFPVRVLRTAEFQNDNYLANPSNRCYFCKFELFTALVPLAREEGFDVIVYGENASDVGDHRPGAQAAAEFKIHAPLKEVGLTKSEIRDLSAEIGLPTADKPQLACLSSRIPYGESVTSEKLLMIEKAEDRLRDLGFREIRVRHHELRQGQLARIELGRDEMPALLDKALMDAASAALTELGYSYVTVDVRGYRRGSLNEVKFKPQARQAAGS